jgi:hypothetical protein
MLFSRMFLEEDTGYFFSTIDVGRTQKGDFLGQVNPISGYYSLNVLGTSYSGKHLAHFYKTGAWPEVTRGVRTGEPKAAKIRVERAPRTAPVITQEMRDAALARKAALEAAKLAQAQTA